jgi:hypothetical protein
MHMMYVQNPSSMYVHFPLRPKKEYYVLVPPGAPVPVPGAAAAAPSPPTPPSPAVGGGGAPDSLSAFIRSSAL